MRVTVTLHFTREEATAEGAGTEVEREHEVDVTADVEVSDEGYPYAHSFEAWSAGEYFELTRAERSTAEDYLVSEWERRTLGQLRAVSSC